MLLSRELIAVFNGGRYVRTIAERDYSGMTVNKHRFYGVSVQDGVLSYAECEDNAVLFHRVTLDSGEERTQRMYFDNAFNAVSDCVFYRDAVYEVVFTAVSVMYADEKSEAWRGRKQ